MEIRIAVCSSLCFLNLAWSAKDLVITSSICCSSYEITSVASSAHRGRGLSLLHIVDAALGDALLVNLGLAAISTIIGEAAQAVLSQAHT